jgi:hypothetical protein
MGIEKIRAFDQLITYVSISTQAPTEHYYRAPNIKVKHSVPYFKRFKPSKNLCTNQCCGSGFSESISGSGSSISNESESGFRILMTKNVRRKKIQLKFYFFLFLVKNYNFLITWPP